MARKDFTAVRDKFANDDGLPFGRLLTREYVLSVLESEGHQYRQRVFCPLVTLWAWLSQSLSQDKSLNEAVSRIVAHRVSSGLPQCSASSASYSEARGRFPLPAMIRMAKEVGRNVHASACEDWNWNGRQVYLVDGTGLSMPDTPENQAAFPQAKSVKAGLGFPFMRAVALISLSTGAVVDFECGSNEGKGTGELSLLRRMLDTMKPGDILVADRYYPSFFMVKELQKRGIDLVSMSFHNRTVDFEQGIQLGEKDHIAEWEKTKRPKWFSLDEYINMPRTVSVREFAIEIEGRDGEPEEAIIVSTMTDPTIAQEEIAELYWKRWNCELDLRSLKQSMHMDVLRCKTPEMVIKEVYCHLLAYNLLRGTMMESARRTGVTPRQLSVKGAMQAVESFTPAMMVVGNGETIYDAFLKTISTHRVANRPGRQEPRFKKRRPSWDTYMTIPRHQSRRKLAGKVKPR